MKTIYAIGDIHGQFDMLVDALERIEEDGGPDARVVFLGDLVDRGPDSFEVIELLRLGVDEGRDWTVLRGNHDQMFLDFVTEGKTTHERILSGKSWLHEVLGGKATLTSYGVDVDLPLRPMRDQALENVPEAHIEFIAGLPLIYEVGHLLFVHAGIRPNATLEEQEFDDVLWIREPFLNHEEPFDWLVVHGHTALEAPQRYSNRVNLDGGAGHGRALGVGVFDGPDVFLLTEMGRAVL